VDDVFSLNSSDWVSLQSRCESSWQERHALEFSIADLISKNDSDRSDWNKSVIALNNYPDKRKTIYVLTMFAYKSYVSIKNMALFYSQIEPKSLRVEAYQCMWKRIAKNRDSENLAILDLDYVWSKENDTFNELETATSVIVDNLCFLNDEDIHYTNWSMEGLRLIERQALLQFLPDVIYKCIHRSRFDRIQTLLSMAKEDFKDYSCDIFEFILKELESRNQLQAPIALDVYRAVDENFPENIIDCKSHVGQDIEELKKYAVGRVFARYYMGKT
jgi:hypothetical protein